MPLGCCHDGISLKQELSLMPVTSMKLSTLSVSQFRIVAIKACACRLQVVRTNNQVEHGVTDESEVSRTRLRPCTAACTA